jgi:hypothetical protein
MKQLVDHAVGAIDWTSVKLAGVSLLFIGGSKLTMCLGVAAMSSTIIYNSIRIYKELKNK